MKTRDLTLLEAARALDEGRCEEIRSPNGVVYNSNDGLLKYKLSHNESISFSIYTLLGKWSLIGVKPQTEERTIEYWLVIWKDGSKPSIYYQYPDWPEIKVISQQVIPLSTTYTFELPEEE